LENSSEKNELDFAKNWFIAFTDTKDLIRIKFTTDKEPLVLIFDTLALKSYEVENHELINHFIT